MNFLKISLMVLIFGFGVNGFTLGQSGAPVAPGSSAAENDLNRQKYEDDRERRNEVLECKKANREALKDLRNSCSKSGFSTDPTKCQEEAVECKDLINSINGDISLSTIEENFKDGACSAAAESMTSLLKDNVSDFKESRKDARNDANDLQDDLLTASKEISDIDIALSKFIQDGQQKTQELETSMEDRTIDSSDRVKEAQAKFQDALLQIEAKRDELRTQAEQAKVGLKSNLDAADEECEDKSEKEFEERVLKRSRTRRAARRDSVGGLNALLGNNKRLEHQRQLLARNCRAKSNYINKRENAQRGFSLALKGIDDLLKNLDRRVKLLEDNFNRNIESLSQRKQQTLKKIAEEIIKLQQKMQLEEQNAQIQRQQISQRINDLQQRSQLASAEFTENDQLYRSSRNALKAMGIRGRSPAGSNDSNFSSLLSAKSQFEQLELDLKACTTPDRESTDNETARASN